MTERQRLHSVIWRFVIEHPFYVACWIVSAICIPGTIYLLALPTPDPPTIACYPGMTLLPHQSCTVTIELHFPKPHATRDDL
jgi:hypothetical protein